MSGPPAAVIRDRILAAVGLEARLAVDDGVASAADVDLALRLGAAHPAGPFEGERAAKPDGAETQDR
jgi:3-hydroxyacyl-CoA dehydrogenase